MRTSSSYFGVLGPIALLLLVVPCRVHASPELEAPSVVDLGKQTLGAEILSHFVIRNQGNAPLIVDDIKKSCGCTSVDIPQAPIPPGQSVSVSFTIKVSQAGSAKLFVYSNDSETPFFPITILTGVDASYNIRPSHVRIYKGSEQSKSSAPLHIQGETGLRIDRLIPDSDEITVSVVRQIEGYVLLEVSSSEQVETDVHTSFTIEFEHPKIPSVVVPVFIEVEQPVAFLPGSLVVALSADALKGESIATFEILTKKPMAVESVECELPFVRFNFSKEAAYSNLVTCSLETLPPNDLPVITGKILVKMADRPEIHSLGIVLLRN